MNRKLLLSFFAAILSLFFLVNAFAHESINVVHKEFGKSGLDDAAGATNRHHSFPQFAGGDPKQALTTMSKDLHVQLHQDLTAFLKENYPQMVTKSGYPGALMQQVVPESVRIQALTEFYTGVGAKYADAAADFFRQIR